VDNFNCKCATGGVWNDYINECVACSSIANSTGVVVSIYGCGCNSGFFWDSFSFSCRPTTCAYAITDSRCAYCLRNAGIVVIPQLLIVTATEKTMLLSGDSLYSYYVNLASPRYLNYASYKCLCATNYTWSVSRRRCYNKTLNATA
jgi:hypothetical protein